VLLPPRGRIRVDFVRTYEDDYHLFYLPRNQFDDSLQGLQVLLFNGGELSEKEAIQRSKDFNAYVKLNKIDLPQ
jgi:hypothetical protein